MASHDDSEAPAPSSDNVSLTSSDEAATEPSGCCGLLGCWARPYNRWKLFLVAFLLCLVGIGNCYCYDLPGALQSEIETAFNATTSEFSQLYSLYSYPNLVFPIFGGILIDSVLGLNASVVIFTILLVAGQSLFSLGLFLDHIWLLYASRIVYALGGESLNSALNVFMIRWFEGRGLNAIMGFQLSVSRIGTSFVFMTATRIVTFISDKFHLSTTMALGYASLVALALIVLSLLSILGLAFMERQRQRLLNISFTLQRSNETAEADTSLTWCQRVRRSSRVLFTVNFAGVTIILVLIYAAILPFASIDQKYIMVKYNWNSTDADSVNTALYAIAAILSPFLGAAIDKIGRNLTVILLSCLSTLAGHCLFFFTNLAPWYGISLLGLGYSGAASALWPLYNIIVPRKDQGVGYGVCQAIQNIGLALAPFIAGKLYDEHGAHAMELSFFLYALVAVATSLALLVYDSCLGKGLLNMSGDESRKFLAEREAAEEEGREAGRPLLDEDAPRHDEIF